MKKLNLTKKVVSKDALKQAQGGCWDIKHGSPAGSRTCGGW